MILQINSSTAITILSLNDAWHFLTEVYFLPFSPKIDRQVQLRGIYHFLFAKHRFWFFLHFFVSESKILKLVFDAYKNKWQKVTKMDCLHLTLGRKPDVIYFCVKGNAKGNSVLNAVIPLKVTE